MGNVRFYNDKVLFDSGKVAMHEDCCCPIYVLWPCWEKAGEDCQHCDVSPKYLTIILAGVDAAICDCVENPPFGCKNSIGNISVAVDGAYALPKGSGTSCEWGTAIANAISFRYYYGASDCTGPYQTYTRSVGIVVARPTVGGETLWTITVRGGPGPFTGHASEFVFYGTLATSDGDCVPLGDTIVNTYSCNASCDFVYPIYYELYELTNGGTATLWAGDIYELAGATSCPGGAPIYTDTDLSAYVGDVVNIGDKCYVVGVAEPGIPSDGAVTVIDSYNDCDECCADV